MKGILVKGLLLAVILSGSVMAQVDPTLDAMLIFDASYTQIYARSLARAYPTARDFNGGGVRARGMGNAFIGISDDASAVTWNPAGLYRQDNQYTQPVISIGYQSFSADAAFKSQPYYFIPSEVFDVTENSTGVNFLSVVAPIRVKGHMFVGSVAYSRMADEFYNGGMNYDVEYYFTLQDFLDLTTRPFNYNNVTTYRSWANSLNIGFGTRMYDKLSFGVGVNIASGGSAQRMEETMTWEGLLIPGVPNRQRGVGVQVTNIYDSTAYSGVNFTLGLKYTTDRFSGGIILKTPFALKETTDELIDVRGYANGTEDGNAAAKIHSDRNIVELDQPMIIGVGAGFKAKENLLFAVDVEYRPYEGGMVNVRDSLELVPGGTDIEYFTIGDPYWNNAWTIRAGSEYVWETGNRLFPTIPLRIGYGWAELPAPNIVVEPTTPIVDSYVDTEGNPLIDPALTADWGVAVSTMASTTKWSLGAGIRWAQIDLDFAYEKSSGSLVNMFLNQKSVSKNGSFTVMFTGYF